MLGLGTIIPGVIGAAAALGIALFYNAAIDNPSVVRETTKRVEQIARTQTLNAINEVTDASQKARAMRRYCLDNGQLYNFATGQCRDK